MQIDLRQGDCLEILKNIPDKSIDLVVTDPPYRFENQGGGFYAKNASTQRSYLDQLKQINCCEFDPHVFLDLLKSKMKQFYGYFFCNKTLIVDYIQWATQNKYNYDVLVMAKSNPIPSYNNHHLSDLEYIIMIREKGTFFSKHKNLDDFRKFFVTSCKKGIHPAEKPVELLERFIRVSSDCNAIILDPFMGSGATGVACINTGRKFIGIELDETYFKTAQDRINNTNPGEAMPAAPEADTTKSWLDELLEGCV